MTGGALLTGVTSSVQLVRCGWSAGSDQDSSEEEDGGKLGLAGGLPGNAARTSLSVAFLRSTKLPDRING